MVGIDMFWNVQKSLVSERNQNQGRSSASYTVSPSSCSSWTKRLINPFTTRVLPSLAANRTVAGVRISFDELMFASFDSMRRV